MFCPRCGAKNEDGSTFCSSCGGDLKSTPSYSENRTPNSNYNGTQSYSNYGGNQEVKNYLVWAILSTIFCCVPFGIPAIVYASQVDTRLRTGDFNGALESSRKAKTWCWVAFGSGLAVGIIYFFIMILSFSSM